MEKEQIQNDELDRVLNHVLTSDARLEVPTGLSDKLLRKIEKKLLLRELIIELCLKVGIVLGSLVLLAGLFILLKGTDTLSPLKSLFVINWQLISSVVLIVFITVLIDQIGLKFVTGDHRQVGLKL